MNLEQHLDDLESRLDPEIEEDLEAQWKTFIFDGWSASPVFTPRRKKNAPPKIEWHWPSTNATIGDDEESFHFMALQQLCAVSGALHGGHSMLNVRCNYGTGILPSLFGAPVAIMDKQYELLPTATAIPGGLDAIRRVVASPVPCHEEGWGARVFEMARRFRKLLDSRPKVKRYVHLYHPDIQGPLDVLEMCVGSNMFLALVDEPELMLAFLDRITDAYIGFLDAWLELTPPRNPGWSVHWGVMLRGHAMLRLDSGNNLSPEMMDRFSIPFDARILKRYGGGVHACGRVDHYYGAVARIEGCHCLNMSQPEMNDMEKVYRETIDRGVRLISHPWSECVRLSQPGARPTHGLVQG